MDIMNKTYRGKTQIYNSPHLKRKTNNDLDYPKNIQLPNKNLKN